MIKKRLWRRASSLALALTLVVGGVSALGVGARSISDYLSSRVSLFADGDDPRGKATVKVYIDEGGEPDQAFVELIVAADEAAFITSQGSIGLWYDSDVLVPSTIDGNDPITDSGDFLNAVKIPDTKLYPRQDDTDNEDDEILLSDIFYSDLSVPTPAEGIYLDYDPANSYVALQYWCVPNRNAGVTAMWQKLEENDLAVKEDWQGISYQLKVSEDDYEDGLVMVRMSFKVLEGEKLGPFSFNFAYFIKRSDEDDAVKEFDDVQVYIQDGEKNKLDLPYYNKAELIIVDMEYPPPPYGPSAVNNGDETVTIHVKGIFDAEKGYISVPSGVLFNIYIGNPNVDTDFIKLSAFDFTKQPYAYNVDGDDPTDPLGAIFTFRIPTEEDYDDPDDYERVREILDDPDAYARIMDLFENGGTVYLSTQYMNNESLDNDNDELICCTELVIPKAVVWTGTLISYAPTHEATITLYPLLDDSFDGSEAEHYSEAPAFATTISTDDDPGRCEQEYRIASSALPGTYKLVIEKPSHVTYTLLGLVIEPPDDPLDKEDENFLQDNGVITLFCGDINGDGRIKLNDRAMLLEYINNPSKWKNVSDGKGNNDSNNPKTPGTTAYLMDLNGDGKITLSDLSILMDGTNYNKKASDYLD